MKGGIYIHIPFCKKSCSYCNFYFSVSQTQKTDIVEAILKEINMHNNFLKTDKIQSVYFGGGTPSLLETSEIERILTKVKDYYDFEDDIEITLEANPDDINRDYLKRLKDIGINRFSLGVQSFIDKELKLLGRNHSAEEAIKSIKLIQDSGFDNFNIDLIFGIPDSGIENWEYNLNLFDELSIPHLSCYGLTIEPNTKLNYQIEKQKIHLPDEELAANIFCHTIKFLEERGYIHYEISNYAKEGKLAIHNTNYWKDIPYLGLGPSAHSYNGKKRRWNIASTKKYIDLIMDGKITYEEEVLSRADSFNEYILTGLRTKWGVNQDIINSYGSNFSSNFFNQIKKYIESKKVKLINGNYILTNDGKLIADNIMSDLFVTR